MYNPQSPDEMDTSTKDITQMENIDQCTSNIIEPNLKENASSPTGEQPRQVKSKSSLVNSTPVAASNKWVVDIVICNLLVHNNENGDGIDCFSQTFFTDWLGCLLFTCSFVRDN